MLLASLAGWLSAQPAGQAINLNDIQSDLVVPDVTDDLPAAGQRVRQVNPGDKSSKLFHVLYLPTDWQPDRKYPVIVEYPGNGNFKNKLGDVSTGRVEDCKLGYGLTEGRGFIWVCLPFVDQQTHSHTIKWWGDAEATATYCRQTVTRICREYGGDPASVILAGFSRGAIAGNYIGLRDDETARLWRGMILHSHYDGVRKWGYPGDDPESARQRLRRFKGKPQFITQENSTDDIKAFLKTEDIRATFVPLPYPNHTDVWVLKDIPERRQARQWLAQVLKQ